jgi:azurin
MMAIVTLVHTGKKDETTDGEELLGYKRIVVETVEWNGKHNAFIASCVHTGSDGMGSYGHNWISDMQDDINNGYLAQETKGGE